MVRAIKIEEMVCFGDGYGILQYISAAHEAPFATGNGLTSTPTLHWFCIALALPFPPLVYVLCHTLIVTG